MLRGLYELGIPGKVDEFTAYRILMLLHGQNRSGGRNFVSNRMLSLISVFCRLNTIRRSTDTSTEIAPGCEACLGGTTCSRDRELPRTFRPISQRT
jgi:hypothetical protein